LCSEGSLFECRLLLQIRYHGFPQLFQANVAIIGQPFCKSIRFPQPYNSPFLMRISSHSTLNNLYSQCVIKYPMDWSSWWSPPIELQ
jgi:hypothetical protein